MKIAIFAPSRGSNDPKYLTELQTQKIFLETSGFTVDCPDDLINPPIKTDWAIEWANSKEERARRIINILNNPEIDAMWATNGGESAIEVVNLLYEYNKDPEKIKKQITESYLTTNAELPENFFLPERLDLFDYSKGALPKRGIACIGMSDVSGINNFLGQKGIVSPIYGDGLLFPNLERSQDIINILKGEKKSSRYSGLAILGDGNFRIEEPLEIYATVDGWIASSCGTNFQFALQRPSILAIESIEEGNVTGLILQQAFEAGALKNVKAIVIGRIKDGQVGDDLEKYPALKEFVEKSGIAVFTTNGNLETGENTFGHGRGGITEPFINFASANLTEQEDGSYNLEISGSRSQENLDFYYQSESLQANKTKVFSDHKKTEGNISIEDTALEKINSGEKQNLDESEIINTNYRNLRLTNGTTRQLDLKDKVLLISGDDGSAGEMSFLHQALVENHLSGSLNGAKSVIIAIPSYKELSIIDTLKTLTDPNIPYKKDEQGNYLIDSFPKRAFDNFLKRDLDQIESGCLSYSFEPQGNDEKGIVKITIHDEKLVEQARKDKYERSLEPFRAMFSDATKSYLPNIPVYLVEDDIIVKTAKQGLQSGRLQIKQQQTLYGIDPNSKEMVSYIDTSKLNPDWKGLEKEIESFHEIIVDKTKPQGEKIDAKGYFAICQFKILGYLAKGSEEEKAEKLARLEQEGIFKKYFDLRKDKASYQDVFDATEKYSQKLYEDCKGFNTYPHQSSLNSALANLIKLPMYDQRLNKTQQDQAVNQACENYASKHFSSAKKVADLGENIGNGRGHIILRACYNNFCNQPAYLDALKKDKILKPEELNKENLEQYAKISANKAAELGYLYAYGALGDYAKKDGNYQMAIDCYSKAIDAGYKSYEKNLKEVETKRNEDALDLAKPNIEADQKDKIQEKSWVERMTGRKLSTLKGVREL